MGIETNNTLDLDVDYDLENIISIISDFSITGTDFQEQINQLTDDLKPIYQKWDTLDNKQKVFELTKVWDNFNKSIEMTKTEIYRLFENILEDQNSVKTVTNLIYGIADMSELEKEQDLNITTIKL